MITFVVNDLAELSKRRTKLALQADIPDMRAYAEAWRKLGADFETAGAPANAAICFNNWQRYSGQAGQYKRKVKGSFAFVELKA